MKKLITSKNLTIINFIIATYFVLIYLLNHYKIDLVIIGIFRELLTIPFLLAQFVFLVIGIKHFTKYKRNVWVIISLIALIACTVLTIGSFF